MDERSLAWVDGFIARQREGWLTAGDAAEMAGIPGAFAGEVVIAQHGGTWVQDEAGIAVEIDEGLRVFPMTTVRKQIEGGEGHSVLGWYRTIDDLRTDRDGDDTAR